jgi:hypothetical protein
MSILVDDIEDGGEGGTIGPEGIEPDSWSQSFSAFFGTNRVRADDDA